jgi:hypothetical protein
MTSSNKIDQEKIAILKFLHENKERIRLDDLIEKLKLDFDEDALYNAFTEIKRNNFVDQDSHGVCISFMGQNELNEAIKIIEIKKKEEIIIERKTLLKKVLKYIKKEFKWIAPIVISIAIPLLLNVLDDKKNNIEKLQNQLLKDSLIFSTTLRDHENQLKNNSKELLKYQKTLDSLLKTLKVDKRVKKK